MYCRSFKKCLDVFLHTTSSCTRRLVTLSLVIVQGHKPSLWWDGCVRQRWYTLRVLIRLRGAWHAGQKSTTVIPRSARSCRQICRILRRRLMPRGSLIRSGHRNGQSQVRWTPGRANAEPCRCNWMRRVRVHGQAGRVHLTVGCCGA